jgi:hypothetical protein
MSPTSLKYGLSASVFLWIGSGGMLTAQVSPASGTPRSISRIEFQSSPSALLCGFTRTTLNSDGHALLIARRCRNTTPEDRTTFCEIKEGKIWPGSYARLARLIEQNGFFALHADYSRNVTDATFENTRVTRNGKRYEVENYADAGPFRLWVIQRAIEGVASSIEWEKPTTQPECPKWDEKTASR